MDVIEMRRELASMKTEVETLLDKGENKRASKLLDEAEKLKGELEKADAGSYSGGPIKPDPGAYTPYQSGGIRTASASTMPGRSYRSLFHDGNEGVSLNQGTFNGFPDFMRSVMSDRFDPRLEEQRVHLEGTPSAGGFAVPEEYGAMLIDKTIENDIFMGRATLWPMTTESKKVPAWANADHSSNLFGGFSGVWAAENATQSVQTGELRQIQLRAKKCMIFGQLTREMLEDSPGFEGNLIDAMSKALRFYMDDAFINGDGVGKPLGLINDPALISISKETGQAADTIIAENIMKMWARCHPACRSNAVWIAGNDTVPQLLQMSIAVGTGGDLVYMPMSGGLGAAPLTTLLGRPVIYSEKSPVLGDAGDIILVDLSQYIIGLRKEVAIDKSNAPGWTEDAIDYRVVARLDGQGSWDSAITPKSGADTLSYVTCIEART